MIKFLKICIILGTSVLNCITIYFLTSLFLKFEQNVTSFISKIAIAVIIITIITLLVEMILMKFVTQENISESINKIIRGLNTVSTIMFFVYFICFAIQTRNIERGTELYMKMMYPGILPIVSGILLRLSLKK